jgi:AbrB family looped-hinge helix DNA binding protein
MKKSDDEKCKNEKCGSEFMHGKHLYGTVVVGERGQIVIPKETRTHFNIAPGDKLFVMGHRGKGIVLVKADMLKAFAENILKKI